MCAIVPDASNSSTVLVSVSPIHFCFPKTLSFYWGPIGISGKCWGREAFYNVIIKSQFFKLVCVLACDFQKYFLAFPPPFPIRLSKIGYRGMQWEKCLSLGGINSDKIISI